MATDLRTDLANPIPDTPQPTCRGVSRPGLVVAELDGRPLALDFVLAGLSTTWCTFFTLQAGDGEKLEGLLLQVHLALEGALEPGAYAVSVSLRVDGEYQDFSGHAEIQRMDGLFTPASDDPRASLHISVHENGLDLELDAVDLPLSVCLSAPCS